MFDFTFSGEVDGWIIQKTESLIQLFFKLFDERYGKAADEFTVGHGLKWFKLRSCDRIFFNSVIYLILLKKWNKFAEYFVFSKKKLSIDVIFVQLLKTIDKK